MTSTVLVHRKHLKVILDSEVIRDRRISEIYVLFRRHGFYVGWGGGR